VNAGPARQRITVTCKSPSLGTSGQDDFIGGTGSGFTRWAHVKSIKGRVDDDGIQQTEGKRFFKINMRYDSGIDYGCVLTYKGRSLHIERIDNVREINHELIIYAYEVDL